MKVVLADGSIHEGANANDIVMQLKLEDWTSYSSTKEYKKNIARRVKVFNGKTIKYKDDQEFLQELKRINFITKIIE